MARPEKRKRDNTYEKTVIELVYGHGSVHDTAADSGAGGCGNAEQRKA